MRLTILRGLPGSGKSNKAAVLGGTILSSDDYFMVGGSYRFDAGRLGLAHEWNQDRCRKAMEAGNESIVIDNTNTRLWEMEPYKSLARRYGYEIVTFTVEEWDVDVCAARNTHGVPRGHIVSMRDRFERET